LLNISTIRPKISPQGNRFAVAFFCCRFWQEVGIKKVIGLIVKLCNRYSNIVINATKLSTPSYSIRSVAQEMGWIVFVRLAGIKYSKSNGG